MLVSKAATVVKLKLRSRKSASGITGSETRVSTRTKMPANTTAPTMRPMIVGEFQSKVDPPQVAMRTIAVVATPSVAMPR